MSIARAPPPRVLACLLCQQRKVKCDRKFPCAHCIKANVQCVPATSGPRQRRRRFPERLLLERLRQYEELLSQHSIAFEPLHTPVTKKESLSEDGGRSRSVDVSHSEESEATASQPSVKTSAAKSETMYQPKDFWNALTQRSRDSEDEDDIDDEDEYNEDDEESFSRHGVRKAVVKKAWDQFYKSNDHLLFGVRKTNVDISTMHPEQVQIFRLWQIYLENIDPLLKVTHTPTLQARIIDAASDVTKVNPALEALMFAIYCVSILSLDEDDCSTMFGTTKEDLLTNYQFGCQQALLNCGLLRTSDRECLTAFYLYLISVRPGTDPRSLSSMLGVAVRIAQRMGIHSEATYAKYTVLEAEMRRRLWWSIIVFDNRICEMSDYRSTILAPTWDCRTPLNVNDFDIRLEMKSPPEVQEKPSEAIFAVLRSELGNFLRHSAFHLDFSNPSLKNIAKDTRHGSVLEAENLIDLEKTVEDRYLKFCNPENALHYMTIWTTRGFLAKNRLLEYYSKYSDTSVQQTESQRDDALSCAIRMLECDTQIMSSPLIKRYLWLAHLYFPFTAYIHIVHDLKKRPTEEHFEKTWDVMSDNYEARSTNMEANDKTFLKLFSRIVLQAWEVYESVFGNLKHPLEQPRIVSSIKYKLTQMTPSTQYSMTRQPSSALSGNIDHFPMPMHVDAGSHYLSQGTVGQGFVGLGSGGYTNVPGQTMMDIDVNQIDWTQVDWNPMFARGW